MRHLTTLLLLLPLCMVAQTTWAPIGAKWTYTQGHFGGPDSSLAVIQVDADTVIGGKVCRRLVMTEGLSTCYGLLTHQYVSGDSLYYWDDAAGRFHLLFRWDALPGETWSTPMGYEMHMDTIDWTVTDTSSIVLDGIRLKQWSVHQANRQWLFFSPITLVTERLGPSDSPFTWSDGVCDAEHYRSLRCFEENTMPEPQLSISWLNPRFPQCELTEPVPAAIRFDDPQGVWFVAHTHPEGNINDPSFAATRTTRYSFGHNMTIEGDLWRRINTMPTASGSSTSTYQGAVRRIDQLVLFMDTMGTIDTLYNFDLQVGDSVRYPDFGAPSPYLTVEAIDTIIIQNHPHRRYHFSEYPQSLEDTFTDTWIEGIGSIHGPLAPRIPSALGHHHGSPDSTRTTCYFRWQDRLWHHPGYSHCVTNIPLGMDEQDAAPITVYPNPATDAVHIAGLPPQRGHYRLLDVTGRIHATGTITGHGPHRVGLQALPAGMYVLCIEGDGGRSFRVVKE